MLTPAYRLSEIWPCILLLFMNESRDVSLEARDVVMVQLSIGFSSRDFTPGHCRCQYNSADNSELPLIMA